MAEEQKVAEVVADPPPPAPAAELEEPPKVDVSEEKALVPLAPPPPPPPPPVDDSKALPKDEEKSEEGSINRDRVLAKVESEKRLSLIRAWEESEKSKAENKAQKKLSAVDAWENSRKASLEAELRQMEERLLRKKAEYAEKMKNKIAMIHKAAEEKKAMVEAKRGEDLLKAEEMAAKYRATGTGPKKMFGCF